MWTLINEDSKERFILQTKTENNPDNGLYLIHNIPGNWFATFKLVESDNYPSYLKNVDFFDNNKTRLPFARIEASEFVKYTLQEDTYGIVYSGGFLIDNPVSTGGNASDKSYFLVGGGLFEFCNSKPQAYPSGTSLITILDNLLKYSKLDSKIDYSIRLYDDQLNKLNRWIIPNNYKIKDVLNALTEEVGLSYFVKPDSSIYISNETNLYHQNSPIIPIAFLANLAGASGRQAKEEAENIKNLALYGNTTGLDIRPYIFEKLYNGSDSTAEYENVFTYLQEEENLIVYENNSNYQITSLNDFNLNIINNKQGFLVIDNINQKTDFKLRIIINCIEYYDDKCILYKKQPV